MTKKLNEVATYKKPREPVLVMLVHDNKEVRFFGNTCLKLTAGKGKKHHTNKEFCI
jgi:hypothetical protein